jgi:hypothetical protein
MAFHASPDERRQDRKEHSRTVGSNSERVNPNRALSKAAEACHVGNSPHYKCSISSSAPSLPEFAFDAIVARLLIGGGGGEEIACRWNGCETDV